MAESVQGLQCALEGRKQGYSFEHDARTVRQCDGRLVVCARSAKQARGLGIRFAGRAVGPQRLWIHSLQDHSTIELRRGERGPQRVFTDDHNMLVADHKPACTGMARVDRVRYISA
jgi:hypothetical protein